MVFPPGSSSFAPILVEVNPLLVASGFRELVYPLLGDLDPIAGTKFGADAASISSNPLNIRMTAHSGSL
jgi:hypothetical protein